MEQRYQQTPMQAPAQGPASARSNPETMPIGTKELRKANDELMRYVAGKNFLDSRVRDDDQWWRMRHMEKRKPEGFGQDFPSAWLFSSVMQKHAYMMENFPECNILPREREDQDLAKSLSSIVPVIKDMNDYRNTYSLNMWRKMQSGTAITGVFWDSSKLNGLGDVALVPVNVINLFWKPGIDDIQKSRYVFHVEWADRSELQEMYPDKDIGPAVGKALVKAFRQEDNVDRSKQVLVVDWYYHRREGQTKRLHYCKYVGETVLYSSENEGLPYWYEDGLFPFVFDVLFPMEGSPAGFGYVDVGRYAQAQIDLINQGVLTNTLMRARPRYFDALDSGINQEELADWSKQIVHVGGNLADNLIRPIEVPNLDGNILNFHNLKIQELKETTSNQDVQTGTTSGGVTAASAIQALQQSAGMPSKDATRTSHRADEEITLMIIERIRQFYDMPRQFRIVGERGEMEFVDFQNDQLRGEQQLGLDGSDMGLRLPEFDVDVTAETENAYTKLTNNELIKDLYGMGMFNPQNASIAMVVLQFLDIPKKDEIMDAVRQNGTYLELMQQYGQLAVALLAQSGREQEAQQLAAQLAVDAGGDPAQAQQAAPREKSAAEKQVLGQMSNSEQKTRAKTDAATAV